VFDAVVTTVRRGCESVGLGADDRIRPTQHI